MILTTTTTPSRENNNGLIKETDQNGHYCYPDDMNCVDSVFVDDDEEVETVPKNEPKKKRSVSESDKEDLAERHFGPVCKRHKNVAQCFSVPLEKDDETICWVNNNEIVTYLGPHMKHNQNTVYTITHLGMNEEMIIKS